MIGLLVGILLIVSGFVGVYVAWMRPEELQERYDRSPKVWEILAAQVFGLGICGLIFGTLIVIISVPALI